MFDLTTIFKHQCILLDNIKPNHTVLEGPFFTCPKTGECLSVHGFYIYTYTSVSKGIVTVERKTGLIDFQACIKILPCPTFADPCRVEKLRSLRNDGQWTTILLPNVNPILVSLRLMFFFFSSFNGLFLCFKHLQLFIV
ncbi:hypothetical protein K2173_009286 [Erythroxylum novogranatense]|uniref:Uncharacterized protein n=1 Tax=Erythroxylum novogranatense TaxID=1862640 RepID=A0AAV8T017_9ROSI|nr:hypothetical protein K2173_009286 [Erythroxylum novogranatense]